MIKFYCDVCEEEFDEKVSGFPPEVLFRIDCDQEYRDVCPVCHNIIEAAQKQIIKEMQEKLKSRIQRILKESKR